MFFCRLRVSFINRMYSFATDPNTGFMAIMHSWEDLAPRTSTKHFFGMTKRKKHTENVAKKH